MQKYLPGNENKQLLILLSAIVIVLLIAIYVVYEDRQLSFLLWNLFLAWAPLLILYVISALPKRLINKVISITLIAIWALFYPNAPYMVTSLLHTPMSTSQLGLNIDILLWLKFSVVFISLWLGILLSFYALYPIHRTIISKTSKSFSHAFVIIISLLSSYGIYLGRFPRLNSWDIFYNPRRVFYVVQNSFNQNTLVFILLFALIIYTLYTSLYKLKHNKMN